jgi:NADPH-dependent ferric siderophore reductase
VAADLADIVARIAAELKLTTRQVRVLLKVVAVAAHARAHSPASPWYRAADQGERVTLASLHAHGLLDRRVWRGSGASAAHEYQPVSELAELVRGSLQGE